jgi:GNAT superfamily N-acetyltransferase
MCLYHGIFKCATIIFLVTILWHYVDMKYRVVPVDTRQPEVVQLLTLLQKACLPADVVYKITDKEYWYVAYTHDGEAVGFAGVVPSARWSDTMYLCRAGVVLAHRGRGLQKKLIKARIRKAKALGMNWIITDTNENPASANSLIATGFKMFEPSKPWGLKTALYWKYKINHAV